MSISVKNLSVFYEEDNGLFFSRRNKKEAVKEVSFEIYRGESLGLVGESGCGKTSLSKAILGMNRDIRGEIIHQTVRPQMIFQDPYSSLNPSKTIGWLLEEPLRAAYALEKGSGLSGKQNRNEWKAAAMEMLEKSD